VARAVVAATWREAPVLGPLLADQLLSIAIAVACVAILLSAPAERAMLDARIGDVRRRVGRPRSGDSPRGSIVRSPGGEASGSDEMRGQG
jgi:hypothetical protein